MDVESESAQNARVNALWHSLDTKGTGQLDLAALKNGLKKIDHPLQNADDLLKDVLKAVDLNGDGSIQYNEFCTFVKHAEHELWGLFKTIDQDKNDKLTKSELKDAFMKAGITVPNQRLDDFFDQVDSNHDGVITFDEWRDFLLFVPAGSPTLKKILSYYQTGVKMNAEGDVHVSDDAIEGLGTSLKFPFSLFVPPRRSKPSPIRHRPPDLTAPPVPKEPSDVDPTLPLASPGDAEEESSSMLSDASQHPSPSVWKQCKSVLMTLVPTSGYFLAGGIAGIVSRTSTAPLDRLKVYLMAQIDTPNQALKAAKSGAAVQATRHAGRTLVDACKALWRAGGVRSLFAGNGLNVVKVMPESAIKFGSYEASKRLIAQFEGHGDPQRIHPWSQFVAGGMGGIISQFFVYPIDTLKFRMQCETVEGGLHGNKLIADTAHKMWKTNGIRSFYRGLPMGLVGMFPYAAIDLGTFETLKKAVTKRNAKRRGCHEEDAAPGSVATAAIGGFSGALGASTVYPLNLLRTRLQTQGTAVHRRTYTGIMDVTRQTLQGEGVRGLFKGLTVNLLKVIPAVSITYVAYENSKKMLELH